MKIKVTCKLKDNDARYFLDPILQSKRIDELVLYRNGDPYQNDNDSSRRPVGVYYSGPLKLLWRLIKMIIDKPDANLVVGIYEIPHGLLALLAAKYHRTSVVISIIGNPKFYLRNKGLRGIVTKWLYNQADVITVTGSKSKVFLIERKKIPANKIFILPNSIPDEEFLIKKEIAEKKYDLITLGRLSHEKGLFNLLDIVDRLRIQMPSIKLGIAGEGPLYQELLLKIKELGLGQNVDFLGYVESANTFLNSGKLFVTTSFTEGLPRTAIQSMFVGIPVIASNVGDMPDLIINGQNGILINDPNDKDAFIEGIYHLLKDKKRYQEYSINAVQHSKNLYSHSTATGVWNNIFEYLNV